MKKLISFLLIFMVSSLVNAADQRCLLAGDSIQTYVYEPTGVAADQSQLTASLLPTLDNVAVANMSSTGQRMSSSGSAGYGLVSNQNVLWYATGSTTPTCLIIALGTNDWTSTPGTAIGFIQDYRKVVQYAKLLGMKVMCATPTWRADQDTPNVHPDGTYTIQQYRDFVAGVCFEQGVYVFDAMQIGLLPSDFADGLHMNKSGHQKYAAALLDQLKYRGILQ